MSSLQNLTILVVDDEELIREVASMMIEEEGGTALIAKDGIEAIEVFKRNFAKISCVLMDFSMPEMNGYDAYLAMSKIDPKVQVVLVSGLKVVPEVDKLRQSGKIAFINKPFKQADVVTAIRSRLAL
jgi:two-component system cell cycle sensor histidine kinase/response regulator CckA